MEKHHERSYLEDHYRSVADQYGYFYQEVYDGLIPILLKSLDLKTQHIVADIGSGTGLVAENLFKFCKLNNPIWCVDPSGEMQEVARKRKGIYPVQKTAEEFFYDTKISQGFDKIVAVFSVHHFANPEAVYKGIFRSLRPGGSFIQVDTVTAGHPMFKMAADTWSEHSKKVNGSVQLLRGINVQGKISREEFSFPQSVTKSKLYEMFRCRYMSMFYKLSDEQIEEGIQELENDTFKDVKDNDHINYNYIVQITKINLE